MGDTQQEDISTTHAPSQERVVPQIIESHSVSNVADSSDEPRITSSIQSSYEASVNHAIHSSYDARLPPNQTSPHDANIDSTMPSSTQYPKITPADADNDESNEAVPEAFETVVNSTVSFQVQDHKLPSMTHPGYDARMNPLYDSKLNAIVQPIPDSKLNSMVQAHPDVKMAFLPHPDQKLPPFDLTRIIPGRVDPANETKLARISQEERICLSVRNYPELYDRTMDSFKDKQMKDNAWARVAMELGLENGAEAERLFGKVRKSYTTTKNNLRKSYKLGHITATELQTKLEECKSLHAYITWLDPFIKERVRKPFSRHPSTFYTGVPNWNTKAHYVTITKDPDHDSNDEDSTSAPVTTAKVPASNPWAAMAEGSEPPTMGMAFPATSAKASASDAGDRRYQVDVGQNHTSVHGRVPHFYHYPTGKPSPVSLNFPASMVMWKGSPDASMFAPQPVLDAHTGHTSGHGHVSAHSTAGHATSERANGYSLYRDPFQRTTASDVIATTAAKLETTSASTRPSVADSPFLRDDEALFGQLVASQLRQMSVEQKIRAKFEINQIMYKILLLNFSDMSQSNSALPERNPPAYVAVAYPTSELREPPRETETSRAEVQTNKNGPMRESEIEDKFWKEQSS